MKKRHKILYIQKPPGGGSLVALYEMIRVLNKERFEPVVLCYDDNEYTKMFDHLGVKVLYLNKHRPVLLKLPSVAKQKEAGKIFSSLYKFKKLLIDDRRKSKQIASVIVENEIDLIHHNNDINLSRQGVMANRKINLPQICHYRSLKPYNEDKIGFGIDNFLAKKVDFHIYISNAVRDHFANALNIKSNKGVVVRDIIDVEKYQPQAPKQFLLNEFGLSSTDIIITNIGRICKWKGQRIFIEAFAEVAKKYPSAKALIVGPFDPGVGDPEYFHQLQVLIEDLDLKNKIVLTGNRNDIPDILSISDIVVHSAIEPEPQGLVIIEALFYRKPVIVADAGGAAELIVNNEGGLKVEPGNPAALATALEKLIEQSSGDKQQYAFEKKPAIFSEFVPEKQIAIIEGIYESLLN